MVITTVHLHSAKPELRFCASSNPAHGVSEICNGENLWQWSWLEIRLNTFHWSTITQETIHHSEKFNFTQYESACTRLSNNSKIFYLCKKRIFQAFKFAKTSTNLFLQKIQAKESNLKIREETNMFPSMAFTQDLDRFDTDNILSITENELPTDVSNHPELLSHMSKSCWIITHYVKSCWITWCAKFYQITLNQCKSSFEFIIIPSIQMVMIKILLNRTDPIDRTIACFNKNLRQIYIQRTFTI